MLTLQELRRSQSIFTPKFPTLAGSRLLASAKALPGSHFLASVNVLALLDAYLVSKVLQNVYMKIFSIA
jgi:hypothetical protein